MFVIKRLVVVEPMYTYSDALFCLIYVDNKQRLLNTDSQVKKNVLKDLD